MKPKTPAQTRTTITYTMPEGRDFPMPDIAITCKAAMDPEWIATAGGAEYEIAPFTRAVQGALQDPVVSGAVHMGMIQVTVNGFPITEWAVFAEAALVAGRAASAKRAAEARAEELGLPSGSNVVAFPGTTKH